MTMPTKSEQNTFPNRWEFEFRRAEMQQDFEIHVKSISNLIQWALTLGEHESEEFKTN